MLTKIEDPCPIELKRTVREKQELLAIEKATGVHKHSSAKRTLKDKEKVIYAPFSNLGNLHFEKATGYVTIPDSQVIYSRPDGAAGAEAITEGNEGQKMVWKLQDLEAHRPDIENEDSDNEF